ncbi:hypothetical protein TNCV_2926231 [Trichonephila clavipes]|nr:hypothetical protein TNCV_2926231 [Trichonephila clavipes]
MLRNQAFRPDFLPKNNVERTSSLHLPEKILLNGNFSGRKVSTKIKDHRQVKVTRKRKKIIRKILQKNLDLSYTHEGLPPKT